MSCKKRKSPTAEDLMTLTIRSSRAQQSDSAVLKKMIRQLMKDLLPGMKHRSSILSLIHAIIDEYLDQKLSLKDTLEELQYLEAQVKLYFEASTHQSLQFAFETLEGFVLSFNYYQVNSCKDLHQLLQQKKALLLKELFSNESEPFRLIDASLIKGATAS